MRGRFRLVLPGFVLVALVFTSPALALSVRLVSPANGARVAAQHTPFGPGIAVHFKVDPGGCSSDYLTNPNNSQGTSLRYGAPGQARPAMKDAYPGTGLGVGYISTPTIFYGSGGNETFYWYITVTCRTQSGAYLHARSPRSIVHIHG